MISVQEAQQSIRKTITANRIVQIPLERSLGTVLARPIRATAPSPRFDASAMDGYAVCVAELEALMRQEGNKGFPVAGDIRAGDNTKRVLRFGTAMRIATGARVPHRADAIVIQEEAEASNGTVKFRAIPSHGAFIRKRGGEYQKGTLLFEAGTLLSPSVAGCVASLGIKKVFVYKPPIAAIVVTGNEVNRSGRLKSSDIRDANTLSLKTALLAMGITDVKQYHVRDNLRETIRVLKSALRDAEFLLITGGVSVGDADYVRRALEHIGVAEVFWRVKTKPGKPLYFGKRKNGRRTQFIFGLPGNPVSVMVTFQVFVRTAILQSMEYREGPEQFRARLAESISKENGRIEFVRGVLIQKAEGYFVTPIRERDSHMLSGMAKANCLIMLPEQEEFVAANSLVDVMPLRWSIL